MKVILEIGRDELERLQLVLARAQVVQEPPSWWQLSFAEELFHRRPESVNQASVSQVRDAAMLSWPINISAEPCQPILKQGEFSFQLSLSWTDAVGEKWRYRTQEVVGDTVEEWREKCRFRLRWLRFRNHQLNQFVIEAFRQMISASAQWQEDSRRQNVMRWFHGEGDHLGAAPKTPTYTSAPVSTEAAA